MSPSSIQAKGSNGLTLTVVGCGTMGIAILSGIMSSLSEGDDTSSSTEELPPRLPNRFVACVRRPASAKKVKTALEQYGADLTTLADDTLKGVKEADIVLLGCKPYMLRNILTAEGIKEALAGKMLISILAGVSVGQIEEVLYGTISTNDPHEEGRCRIVRAMPNTAAAVRASMTVIATTTPPMSADQTALVNWIFTKVGRVVTLPPNLLDASTALCGSGPALMALVLEAAADGAVAMGIPRADAQMMSAMVMKGTSQMVLNGEHPAILRDKVCTPGGCTIGGLLVLEEGAVRGTMANAVREATKIASGLGSKK